MPNIAILNSAAHGDLRVRAAARYLDDERQHFVPVVMSEFPQLATHYPILLAKDADTGGFYVGAMLGFEAGENLFVDSGEEELYRPLNLQRVPFFTSGESLAIDLDSTRVGDSEGQLLFEPDGGASSYLKSVMATFQQLVPGMERTKTLIAKWLALKLIEPVTIDLAFDDGRRITTDGLYTIDQGALKALPDDAVIDLFRSGGLQAAYLMIASLKQIPHLARRRNDRLAVL